MLHFFLQKSRRISHTGFLHVPRSWLEDTNPPLVGIAGSVLANYRAYRCFVSAWTAKQKRRQCRCGSEAVAGVLYFPLIR